MIWQSVQFFISSEFQLKPAKETKQKHDDKNTETIQHCEGQTDMKDSPGSTLETVNNVPGAIGKPYSIHDGWGRSAA